jgi:hypothetical protein
MKMLSLIVTTALTLPLTGCILDRPCDHGPHSGTCDDNGG